MPMIRFGRIGRRLLGWFLLVAIIPLLFMGYQGYYSARTAIEREVFLHMEAVAATKVYQINQWLEERLSDVRLITANPHLLKNAERLMSGFNALVIEDMISELDSYKSQSPSFNYVCLYDANGHPLCCTQIDGDYIPEFDQTDLFQRVLVSDEPVVTPIHNHPRAGPVVQISNRFVDAQDSTLAILVVTLSLSETLNPIILDSTGLGRTGEAYMVDADKVMLTPSRFMNHPSPLTHTMDTEGIRRALTGMSGSGIYEGWSGDLVLGSWKSIPEKGWFLIAEIRAEEAFDQLGRLRRTTFLVALLTLGAILVVVVLISRSISEPIRILADASREVAQGNLDKDVEVKLSDEVGDLAKSFNQMVRSLKDLRESERNSYETLSRTQEKLLKSEKLAAVGELAASIVHEVRNPLSSVKMNLQILEAEYGSIDGTAKHFQLALSQTERLEIILTDLLDYAKPIDLNLRSFPAEKLISESVGVFRSTEGFEDCEVKTDIRDPGIKMVADYSRLLQVLINVLLNAGQAIDRTGEIRITADCVQESNDGVIRISIEDNGIGITESQMERIFEPFFTTKKSGSGLGLPIARRILQAHQGDIHIRSDAGNETVVTLTLPEAKLS